MRARLARHMTTLPTVQPSARRDEWNRAYEAHQNALFWPNEHLVRFVATRLRRRLTLDEFEDVTPFDHTSPRVFDLGCGMGRHLAFAVEMGFDAYGIDLSEVAVAHAREWLGRLGVARADQRALVGMADDLPWPDGFFDAAVSHAVLDSMPFEVACRATVELHRVLRPGAWVYVDLIASEADEAREEVVTARHETGTVQSYFDFPKVERLLAPWFRIDQCCLVSVAPVVGGRRSDRWHVVAQRDDHADARLGRRAAVGRPV